MDDAGMSFSNSLFTIIYIAAFGSAAVLAVFRFAKGGEEGPKAPVRLGVKTVLIIMAVAAASRLVLLALCYGAAHTAGFGSPLAETWSKWDALQYLRIATQGYFDAQEGWIRIVFFPLYPAAVWMFRLVFASEHVAALAVSWLSLGGACVFLYKLVLLDADERAARRAVKYLLLFPAAVFLGAPFSESMFLMLSLACLYFARTRRFVAACALGSLAALTRSAGVLLTVPVALEMLGAYKLTPPLWRQGVGEKLKSLAMRVPVLLLIPLGTAVYLLLNLALTGDAFLFLRMQSEKWSQSFGSYANSLSVTFRELTQRGWEFKDKLLLWGSQFAVMLIGGVTLPVMAKKLRASYSAYAIVYLFVIFAPTWLLSGFRYYMGLAVLYPALAMLTRRRWADVTMTALFALLMPVYAFAFSMGWLVF